MWWLRGRVRESCRCVSRIGGGRSGLAPVVLGVGHDLLDVVLCLGIGRNASIPLYRTWTSVVCGECLSHVSAEAIELLLEVAGARIDVLSGVPRVVAAERARGAPHEVHEPPRPGPGAPLGGEVGLAPAHRAREPGG